MDIQLVGVAEIAEMLGVSRQRVGQLVETYEDFPKPLAELTAGRVWRRTDIEGWISDHPDRGPGQSRERPKRGSLFSRFNDLARSTVVLAAEEARQLSHNYIGTEHLLLGVIRANGPASLALADNGVTVDGVRERIRVLIGVGSKAVHGHIPFTPRAKKVIELSLREALTMGDSVIGDEHVLLGMLREGEGVAPRVITDLGADPQELQHHLGARELPQSKPALDELAKRAAAAAARRMPPGAQFGHVAASGTEPGSTADLMVQTLQKIEQRLASIEERLDRPR